MSVITKGGIDVETIAVGDIHYEYEYGHGIKVEVMTKPEVNSERQWTWKSKLLAGGTLGEIIDYMIVEKYSHYGPNLYNYKAYGEIK